YICTHHLYLSYHSLFFLNDTATTEIYTLSLQTLFRSRSRSPPSSSKEDASPTNSDAAVLMSPKLLACTRLASARSAARARAFARSEEHTSELQSRENLVCRLLLEKKKYSDIAHAFLEA